MIKVRVELLGENGEVVGFSSATLPLGVPKCECCQERGTLGRVIDERDRALKRALSLVALLEAEQGQCVLLRRELAKAYAERDNAVARRAY